MDTSLEWVVLVEMVVVSIPLQVLLALLVLLEVVL
jgi:hypothetical protein